MYHGRFEVIHSSKHLLLHLHLSRRYLPECEEFLSSRIAIYIEIIALFRSKQFSPGKYVLFITLYMYDNSVSCVEHEPNSTQGWFVSILIDFQAADRFGFFKGWLSSFIYLMVVTAGLTIVRRNLSVKTPASLLARTVYNQQLMRFDDHLFSIG